MATKHKSHVLADIRHCVADDETNAHEYDNQGDEYIEFHIILSTVESRKREAEHSHICEDRDGSYDVNN